MPKPEPFHLTDQDRDEIGKRIDAMFGQTNTFKVRQRGPSWEVVGPNDIPCVALVGPDAYDAAHVYTKHKNAG